MDIKHSRFLRRVVPVRRGIPDDLGLGRPLFPAAALFGTVVALKKKIAELEKYKIRITRIRCLLMPAAICGVFLMLFPKIPLAAESVAMFVPR